MCGKPEADFTTSTNETGKDISIPSVTKFPPKVVVGLMSTTAGTLNSSGEFTCRIGSTPAETSGRTSITSTLCFSTASVSPDSRLSFIRARIRWETIQPEKLTFVISKSDSQNLRIIEGTNGAHVDCLPAICELGLVIQTHTDGISQILLGSKDSKYFW